MDTEINWEQMAQQLRCPSGSDGISMGKLMEESNAGMIQSAIQDLCIEDNDTVLELGYGNGSHVSQLLTLARDVTYAGFDISHDMYEEASRINEQCVSAGLASFRVYDGVTIPATGNEFTKVFTVNTVYFWERPGELLTGIHRVMKAGGSMVIAFVQKAFMQNLPFAQYGFTLYDTPALGQLVEGCGFGITTVNDYTEQVKSKAGQFVERPYTVMTFRKG